MNLMKEPQGDTWHLTFSHPRELSTMRDFAGAPEVTRLNLVEDVVNEVPSNRTARAFSLQPLLDRFTSLKELTVESHLWSPELQHSGITTATLNGAIALTPIAMPSLTTLRMSIMGDEHGCAIDFEDFNWLLRGEGLPRLQSLDVRGLDVELQSRRKPSFVTRWIESPLLPRLEELGIPGQEVDIKELKDKAELFSHLDVLVVSGLKSATDRNPIGDPVCFEMEFSDVPLSQVKAAVAALPRLDNFKPSMNDDSFEQLFARVIEAPVRFDQRPLDTTIGKFCKRGQWERAERLLLLAKQKAPDRGTFIRLRERAQEHVAKFLEKNPHDERGRELHDRLNEQNHAFDVVQPPK